MAVEQADTSWPRERMSIALCAIFARDADDPRLMAFREAFTPDIVLELLKEQAEGATSPSTDSDPLLAVLAERIALQDQRHPEGYHTNRDGVRLAIATVED